jgi:hypothetical protein
MNEELKFYLEQISEAAKKTRLVFYFLLLSSAIIFAFQWKMGDFGWLKKRVEIRRDILDNWDALKTPAIIPSSFTNSSTNIEKWMGFTAALSKMHIDPNQPEDKESVERELKILEEEYDTAFKVPFADVVFDINDFTLFSLLELLALTVAFVYCLAHEEHCLRIAFEDIVEEPQRKELYRKAAMLDFGKISNEPNSKTAKCLAVGRIMIFFVPLVVGFAIVIYDFTTPGAGEILSKGLAGVFVFSEYVLTLILLAVTILAFVFFLRINRFWNAKARQYLN